MGRLKQWWWVGLFCVSVAFAYSQAIKKKKAVFAEYTGLLSSLEKTKHDLILEKEKLTLRIASQEDPAWIEMILMRDLGVVPEGYLKVYFRPPS